MLAAVRAEKAKREAARKAEAEARAYREGLECNLSAFIREAWGVVEPGTRLDWNWHIDAIALHLQALLEDWLRTQVLAEGHLKPVDTSPLPPEGRTKEERAARQSEVLRRDRQRRMWTEARRLGVLLDESTGRVGWVNPETLEEASFRQRFQNIIVNIPPGFAKSRIISVLAVAWMWARWPEWTVIALSVNPRVAMRDADFCRDLCKSPWYRNTFRPEWDFSETQDAKSLYRNTAGGWRLSLGYFAEMVGDRAHAMILDDPNNPQDVHSETTRTSVNQRFDDVLFNRVNDLRVSVRIGVQQRTHVSDWTGHVLRNRKEHWEHLKLAMEATEKNRCTCSTCRNGHTSLGWVDPRKPGELIFELRFPPDVLATYRAQSYTWAGQYQQDPVQLQGNLFRETWWKFWRFDSEPAVPELKDRTIVIPDSTKWETWAQDSLVSADMTFKKTKNGSRVSIGVWLKHGQHRILVDLRWDRMGMVESKNALRELCEAYPWVTQKVVEEKANGAAIMDSLTAGATDEGKEAISGLIGEQVEGSKEARAWAVSPLVEAGNVVLPLHATWRADAIAECSAFPDGDTDDFVDQMSQALRRLERGGGWDDSMGFSFGGERSM